MNSVGGTVLVSPPQPQLASLASISPIAAPALSESNTAVPTIVSPRQTNMTGQPIQQVCSCVYL